MRLTRILLVFMMLNFLTAEKVFAITLDASTATQQDIQDALNLTPPEKITITGNGRIELSSALQVLQPAEVEGSRFVEFYLVDGANSNVLEVYSDNVTLKGFSINANQPGQTQKGQGIALFNVKGFTIDNVLIHNTRDDGIQLYEGGYGRIINSDFYDIGFPGSTGSPAITLANFPPIEVGFVQVSGNQIQGWRTDFPERYTGEVRSVQSHGIHAKYFSHHHIISGNVISYTGEDGILLGGIDPEDLNSSHRNILSANVIFKCGKNGIDQFYGHDNIALGNIVDGVLDYGIQSLGGDRNLNALNKVMNVPTIGRRAIKTTGKLNRYALNDTYNNMSGGISVESGSDQTSLFGNRGIDNGRDHFFIRTGSSNTYMNGNVTYDTSEGLNNNNSIEVQAGSLGNIIDGHRAEDFDSTSPYKFSGTPSYEYIDNNMDEISNMERIYLG